MNEDRPSLSRNRSRSRKRVWATRLVTVVISLSPFILLEIALRWFAPPPAAAIERDPRIEFENPRPLFVLNEQAGRWEIPPERMDFFRPASFLAKKPTGARRVFVLGGSTVQGRPFSTETSLTTWLLLRLQAARAEQFFEVINCGGVSYASYRVAAIVREVLRHQPDLIVIYTGHNEFLEDREYERAYAMSTARRWISGLASNVRTVTWIQDQLRRPIATKNMMPSEVDARLDHDGGLAKYRRDPTWRAGVERHFTETLQGMVDQLERADVPVLLCVPASDLVETPPFKIESLASATPQQTDQLRRAWDITQRSEISSRERLSACDAYLAIDPDHAGANYIAGRLHYERGDAVPAREHLTAARDFDVCPLRATTPITSAVIQIAEQNEVPLIDTIRLLDQRDAQTRDQPDGIADPEFFVDHVHPTVAGHQRIAAEIARKIEHMGWMDVSPGAEQRYHDAAENHLSQLGEAYYARGRQRLEGLRLWAAGRAGKLVPTSAAE